MIGSERPRSILQQTESWTNSTFRYTYANEPTTIKAAEHERTAPGDYQLIAVAVGGTEAATTIKSATAGYTKLYDIYNAELGGRGALYVGRKTTIYPEQFEVTFTSKCSYGWTGIHSIRNTSGTVSVDASGGYYAGQFLNEQYFGKASSFDGEGISASGNGDLLVYMFVNWEGAKVTGNPTGTTLQSLPASEEFGVNVWTEERNSGTVGFREGATFSRNTNGFKFPVLLKVTPNTNRKNLALSPNFSDTSAFLNYVGETGTVTVTQDTTHVHDGTYAAKVVFDGSVHWQGVEVEPPGQSILAHIEANKVYTVSAWVWASASIIGHSLSIQVPTYSFTSGFIINHSAGATVNRQGWIRVSVTFTSESQAQFIPHAQVYTASAIAGGGTFWVSSLLIEQASEVKPYLDGSTGPNGYTTSWIGNSGKSPSEAAIGTPTGETAYDKAVLVDEPRAYYRFSESSGDIARDYSVNGQDGSYVDNPQLGVEGKKANGTAMRTVGETNLISPGTFEGGTESWFTVGTTISSSTTQAWTGTHSLKVVCAGGGSFEGAGKEVTLEAGVTYIFQAMVWREAGKQVRLYVQKTEGETAFSAEKTVEADGTGWRLYTLVFTPNLTRLYQVEVRCGETAATTFYVDAAKVSTLGYVEIEDSNILDLGDNLSLEFIAKADGFVTTKIEGGGALGGKGTSAWEVRLEEETDANHAVLNLLRENENVLGYWGMPESENLLPAEEWLHIIFTKSGTTVKCYINGKPAHEFSNTPQTLGNTSKPMNFGRSSDNEEWWLGAMESAAVYATALSEARAKAHYEAAFVTKHEYTASVTETLTPSQAVARAVTTIRKPTETLSPSQAPTRIYGAIRKVEDKLTGSAKEPELFDNFNRENEAYVNAGAGSTLWSKEGINAGTNNLKIFSGAMGVSANSLNGSTLAKWGPDVKGWAEITEAMGTSEGYVFFSARQPRNYEEIGGNWNGYGFIFIRTGVSTFVHQIRKYTSGSNTGSLASSTKVLALNDQLGFSLEGSKLKMWRKPSAGEWEVLCEATDSTYNEAGYVGIEMTLTTRLDNMWLGTIEAGKGITDTPTFETGHSGSTYLKEVTETLSPSQTPTRATTIARSITQTQSTTDSAASTAPGSFFRSIAESTSISDTVKRVFNGIRAISNGNPTTDQPTTGNMKERSVTETLSTSETVTRATAVSRSLSQALTTSDTVTRSTAAKRALSEALSASETPSRAVTTARLISQSLTTSDAVTRVPILTRTITETLAASDASVRVFLGTRTITDALTTGDSTKRVVTNSRKVSDTFSTSDTPARQTDAHRSINDTVTGTDTVTTHKTFLKLISEALTTTDTPKRSLGGFVRNVAESNVLSDAASRVYNGFRAIADIVTGTDHPHSKIVTIYHGERIVEFLIEEPEWSLITGADSIALTEQQPESSAYPDGDDAIRVDLSHGEIRVNKPDGDLRVGKTIFDKYVDTEFNDRVVIDLEETSHTT